MSQDLDIVQEETVVESDLWVSASQLLSPNSSLKPFDLVEINRFKGVYQHWVMYLGQGNIIHVTQVKGRTEGSLAEKRVDSLFSIARGDPCRINNLRGHAIQRGLSEGSRDAILDAIADVVTPILGQSGRQSGPDAVLVPYAVSGRNCEYYATSWKYGVGFSTQVGVEGGPLTPDRIRASVELLQDLEEPENLNNLVNTFF